MAQMLQNKMKPVTTTDKYLDLISRQLADLKKTLISTGDADPSNEQTSKEKDVELDGRFHCDICGRSYASEAGLKRHRKKEHGK